MNASQDPATAPAAQQSAEGYAAGSGADQRHQAGSAASPTAASDRISAPSAQSGRRRKLPEIICSSASAWIATPGAAGSSGVRWWISQTGRRRCRINTTCPARSVGERRIRLARASSSSPRRNRPVGPWGARSGARIPRSPWSDGEAADPDICQAPPGPERCARPLASAVRVTIVDAFCRGRSASAEKLGRISPSPFRTSQKARDERCRRHPWAGAGCPGPRRRRRSRASLSGRRRTGAGRAAGSTRRRRKAPVKGRGRPSARRRGRQTRNDRSAGDSRRAKAASWSAGTVPSPRKAATRRSRGHASTAWTGERGRVRDKIHGEADRRSRTLRDKAGRPGSPAASRGPGATAVPGQRHRHVESTMRTGRSFVLPWRSCAEWYRTRSAARPRFGLGSSARNSYKRHVSATMPMAISIRCFFIDQGGPPFASGPGRASRPGRSPNPATVPGTMPDTS